MVHQWTEAKTLIGKLNNKGYQTYIVGGAVRDLLLGRTLSDIDIVTAATPKEVSKLFDKTVQLSNQHQTVLVREGQELFEVTTIRGTSFVEDMQRRDLTINSLAMDEHGDLVDVVNGKRDLEFKQLRSIDAKARMTEDPLRMLRVARFISELGFSVAPNLFNTIKENHPLINKVAVERVVKEWVKVLKGADRKDALRFLVETGLYQSIPGLSLHAKAIDELLHLKSLVNESESICWSAFCLCMNVPNEETLKQLNLSNELLRAVKVRMYYYQKRKVHSWSDMDLYDSSIDVAQDVEKLRFLFGLPAQDQSKLKAMWDSLPIHNRSELAVTGGDLLQEFKKEQGPWLKDFLLRAEKLVIERKCLNEKSIIIKELRKCEHC
ncbi:CCA tRNA nucleotidyltransferase [Halalkalibacter alkalisediminis]|uniref:CCA tRNA nucleotidyltransferase n=1 Tax=Halalkalibacter alkalisediminis TaxID=935616 RepID=A0ABV6NGL7_9BACI|nr:CCA tRNA nucleotidyltransferase [Halalkalibacter alkalisediminis]